MKETSNKLRLFLYSTIGLAVICSILFTVSMFVAFDAEIGYFSSAHPLPYIQSALLILSVLLCTSVIFLFPKDSLTTPNQTNDRFVSFASLLCGFVFVGGILITFLSTNTNASTLTKLQKDIFMIIVLSGLIGSIYFIYDAIAPNSNGLTLKVLAAIFVIIYCLTSIIFEHVDLYVPINVPRKNLLFVCFVSFSLFMVQNLRFKTEMGQPRAFLLFSATTTILCTTFSISGLIAHYAGAFKDSSFLVYYLIALAAAIYSLANLLSYTKSAESEQEV